MFDSYGKCRIIALVLSYMMLVFIEVWSWWLLVRMEWFFGVVRNRYLFLWRLSLGGGLLLMVSVWGAARRNSML